MNDPHRARRLALQGLCALDVQGRQALGLIHVFMDESDETPDVRQSAREMLKHAIDNSTDCDSLLVRHAKHWSLDRLAMVDRNILRLAAGEMLSMQTSHRIVISEALQLAREFSTAESPRFVNGVLDAVAKEIAEDKA